MAGVQTFEEEENEHHHGRGDGRARKDLIYDGLGTPTSPTLEPEPDGFVERRGLVDMWIEVWDYAGGARFRGFVAGEGEDRTMFVFFDDGVVGSDLKPG